MDEIAAKSRSLPEEYTLTRRDPAGLSIGAIDAAIAILETGGAVGIDAARRGIPSATALFFLHYHDELVGLGAIKEVRKWYARGIRRESGYMFDPTILELGYVAVCPGHRGLRLSGNIVDALIAVCDGALFATTDDKYMKSTLSHRGFEQRGNEWEGGRGQLSLWLRNVVPDQIVL